MNTARMIASVSLRSMIVGIAYVLAVAVIEVAGGFFGIQMPGAPRDPTSLILVIISGTLIGLFLGPVAARMPASRWRQFWVWTCVLCFNMGSVVIEGAFFVPQFSPYPLHILFVQQLLISMGVSLVVMLLFAKKGDNPSLAQYLQVRPWHSWLWRLLASAGAYLAFYYIFGTINYKLVTEPYYTANAGGLFAPSADRVLLAELVRAPLIILSVALFMLSMRASRRWLAVVTGLMLFWVGGIVPLSFQVNILPTTLIIASAIEIFLQNFLTGVVAAFLFWIPASTEVFRPNTRKETPVRIHANA